MMLPLKLSVLRKEINRIVKRYNLSQKQGTSLREFILRALGKLGVRDIEFVWTEYGKSYKINDYLFSLEEWELVCKCSQTEHAYGGKITSEYDGEYKIKDSKEVKKETWNIYPPIIL